MKVVKNRRGAIVSFVPCCSSMARGIAHSQVIEIVCDNFVLAGAKYTSDPFAFCPFCGKPLKEETHDTEA